MRGDVLYEAGFGSADCDAATPVQAQDIFMIGSITKEFPRLLGYVLEERGFFSRTDVLGDLPADYPGEGRLIRQVLARFPPEYTDL